MRIQSNDAAVFRAFALVYINQALAHASERRFHRGPNVKKLGRDPRKARAEAEFHKGVAIKAIRESHLWEQCAEVTS